MGVDQSWDEVFGDLDVRTLDPDQRLDLVDKWISEALTGKSWAALSGGDEAQLVWDAAVRSFLDGNWVAAILCAHAVAERELAGMVPALSTSALNQFQSPPKRWERMGLGELLTAVEKFGVLDPELLSDLRRLADVRKPYGHWRPYLDEQSINQRVMAEHRATGNLDYDNLVQRLIVRDATHSMRTTAHLYFGSYGFGGP
ncbi:hypothetical protein [Arthrobacter sp.]|uniref:hypothetical protein n=1 Tax=Arthrobacter sp. TaxID=1667 RepID=UPI003A8CE294